MPTISPDNDNFENRTERDLKEVKEMLANLRHKEYVEAEQQIDKNRAEDEFLARNLDEQFEESLSELLLLNQEAILKKSQRLLLTCDGVDSEEWLTLSKALYYNTKTYHEIGGMLIEEIVNGLEE